MLGTLLWLLSALLLAAICGFGVFCAARVAYDVASTKYRQV